MAIPYAHRFFPHIVFFFLSQYGSLFCVALSDWRTNLIEFISMPHFYSTTFLLPMSFAVSERFSHMSPWQVTYVPIYLYAIIRVLSHIHCITTSAAKNVEFTHRNERIWESQPPLLSTAAIQSNSAIDNFRLSSAQPPAPGWEPTQNELNINMSHFHFVLSSVAWHRWQTGYTQIYAVTPPISLHCGKLLKIQCPTILHPSKPSTFKRITFTLKLICFNVYSFLCVRHLPVER